MLKPSLISLAIAAGVSTTAAADIDSFPYAAGLQGTLEGAAGLSFKAQMNQDFGVQLIADPFGSYKTAVVRGLFDLQQGPSWKAFAYGDGALHITDNDGTRGIDTLGLGLGAGLGVQYDIRGLEPSLPAVAVSLDIGGAAEFYNNDVPIYFTSSFGIHYHF